MHGQNHIKREAEFVVQLGFSGSKLAGNNSSTRDDAISRPSRGLTFICCIHQLGYKPN